MFTKICVIFTLVYLNSVFSVYHTSLVEIYCNSKFESVELVHNNIRATITCGVSFSDNMDNSISDDINRKIYLACFHRSYKSQWRMYRYIRYFYVHFRKAKTHREIQLIYREWQKAKGPAFLGKKSAR